MLKKIINTFIALFLVILGVVGYAIFYTGDENYEEANVAIFHIPDSDMQLISTAFVDNQSIPSTYTCDGANVNPPLMIVDPPAGTQSFALVVEDPDAPAKTWLHWFVYNIPATSLQLTEDSVPAGAIQGDNDFGQVAYGGPCPPSGIHRYEFIVYALDIPSLPRGIQKAVFETEMAEHILGKAQLTGRYSK